MPDREEIRAGPTTPGSDGVLTFAEEVLLLLLDEKRETIIPLGKYSLARVLVGAVLLDLALADRIDTDLESLTVMDCAPLGNALLDDVLERIATEEESRSTGEWIEHLHFDIQDVREHALRALVDRRILEISERRVLWWFRVKRYSLIDPRAGHEVRARTMQVLYADDIPDPRDIALTCLADGCGILRTIIPPDEIESIAPRLAQIRRMDLIGRELLAQLAIWKLDYTGTMET